MDNLNEIGLTELSEDSQKEINGGLQLALQLDLEGIISSLTGENGLLGKNGLLGSLLGGGGGLIGGGGGLLG